MLGWAIKCAQAVCVYVDYRPGKEMPYVAKVGLLREVLCLSTSLLLLKSTQGCMHLTVNILHIYSTSDNALIE